MNTKELKSQMMQLWKDTFHDSDEYIRLVFDSYFNPDFVVYREEDGRLEAALLGVPYRFGGLSGRAEANGEDGVRGLYLCGLSTVPAKRGRGVMSSLLEDINRRALDMGFDFTFLIPADEGLHRYYSDRGYVDAFRRVEQRYVSGHDFLKEVEAIGKHEIDVFNNISVSKFVSDSREKVAQLWQFLNKSENEIFGLSLTHSEKDVQIIIEENKLSNGIILTSRNKDDDVVGVLFAIPNNGKKEIEIRYLYGKEDGVRFRLLSEVASLYKNYEMVVFNAPERCVKANAVWSPWYIGSPDGLPNIHQVGEASRVYSPAGHASVYGLLRLLRKEHLLEYLVRNASCRRPESADSGYEQGCWDIQNPSEFLKTFDLMTSKQTAEVLFREKREESEESEESEERGGDSLGKLLGIPQLPIFMALMLD